MREYDDIVSRLFNTRGFHKHDLGPAIGNSQTLLKFEGRYPEDPLYKTRNLVSDMEIRVLKGRCIIYLLEGPGMGGNEKRGVFYEGDLIFVPKMFYYIWKTPGVVFLNECTPPWKEEDQDMCRMTDQDHQTLRYLEGKDK